MWMKCASRCVCTEGGTARGGKSDKSQLFMKTSKRLQWMDTIMGSGSCRLNWAPKCALNSSNINGKNGLKILQFREDKSDIFTYTIVISD